MGPCSRERDCFSRRARDSTALSLSCVQGALTMGTFDLTKLSEEDPSVGEAKKICDQFGKTKTQVLQGHRTGGVEGGVCSAIVHAWIRDGVIGDVGKRRAIRKEFREDFNSMTAMLPGHIAEQDSL